MVAFVLSIAVAGPILGAAAYYPMTLFRDLLTLNQPHVPGFELNRPMWTIQLELVCYALVPALFPLLRRQSVLVCVCLGMAGLAVFYLMGGDSPQSWIVMMFGAFLTGAALAPFNLKFPVTPLNRLPDVSYGTYLYGWPVQMLVVRLLGLTDWALMAAVLPVACLCGYLSHRFVERPAMRWLKGRPRPVSLAARPAPV